MPLTGEAKKEYQRGYMARRYYQQREVAAGLVTAALARKSRQVVVDVGQKESARQVLRQVLDQAGLTLPYVIGKLRELMDAWRWQTVAGQATKSPDNDAQARAAGMVMDLQARAGLMPTASEVMAPTSSGARVRMVQIDPDGTERVLEIG